MRNNILINLFVVFLVFISPSALSASDVNNHTNMAKGTVLITGANRGLGLALAQHFKSDGYHVIGTARKPEEAQELEKIGAKVIQLDVTSDESIANMASALKGVPVDIVVNNAGYLRGLTRGIESFQNTERDEYLYTYNVNVVGPVMVTRALLPNLLLSTKDVKKIINISSHGGIVNRKNAHAIYAYDTSKTALNKITNELAKDLSANNIAVVALAPGHNKTRMGGENGTLEPEVSMAQAKSVIEGLEMKDTGTFVGYSGFSIDW